MLQVLKIDHITHPWIRKLAGLVIRNFPMVTIKIKDKGFRETSSITTPKVICLQYILSASFIHDSLQQHLQGKTLPH
jgi:hypothetical protein